MRIVVSLIVMLECFLISIFCLASTSTSSSKIATSEHFTVDTSKTGVMTYMDIKLRPNHGAILLMGGGRDVDESFAKRVKAHLGRGADVIVLRTSGTASYNEYLSDLLEANSVETLIVDSREKANSKSVYEKLNKAEFIWIAGGDQSEYLKYWSRTPVQFLINQLYKRGGVIGGTSAGMAILSKISYNPAGVRGAISEEVAADFCHPSVRFDKNFLSNKIPTYITDTHFAARDRMGRLVNFLAHFPSEAPLGIAADENTAIFITSDGRGIVDGSGSVYILKTNEADTSLSRCGGETIVFSVKRIRLQAGQEYNFFNGRTNGRSIFLDVDGRDRFYYQPSDPYE